MTYFITATELKASNVLNANLENEYIEPAIREAQSIFLREILGDKMYSDVEDHINSTDSRYRDLIDNYIKPYLEYKVQSILCLSVSFKLRNMGMVNQYGNEANTADLKETKYLQEQYDGKVEFYGNRLTKFLQTNSTFFTKYAYDSENITNPSETITRGTIYLGNGRKRTSGLKNGTGGGSTTTVYWDDIVGKPSTEPLTLTDADGVEYTINVYKS